MPKNIFFNLINSILIFFLPNPEKLIKSGSITVVGMLRAASGTGQAIRLTMNALIEQGYKITSFDVSNLFVSNFLNLHLPLQISSKQEGGVLIIQNNPIHLPVILFLLGRKRLRNKKIIAYSVWETESIPDAWVRSCKLVHEIWTPSDFSAKAFRSKIKTIPIRVVPHPLRAPKKVTFNRKFFELPNGIIILIIADLRSGFNRKNIIGSLEVFRKISAKAKNATMVLKLSSVEVCIKEKEEIDKLISEIPNIIIIDKFLTVEEMQGLLNLSDIVVSLHRSEGFGLLMAEAMWHSKAILATPWSANMTFLPKDSACYVKYKLVEINDSQNIYKDKGVWAEPDIKDAAAKLLKLINDKKLRDTLGENAKKHAMKFFTKEAFAGQTDESLKKYAEKF
jgi:glycosyltransferase involved in cell wall biosynthesis